VLATRTPAHILKYDVGVDDFFFKVKIECKDITLQIKMSQHSWYSLVATYHLSHSRNIIKTKRKIQKYLEELDQNSR